MKYKDPVTGEIKSISVKASDTLPMGSVVEFEGDIIPEGWEKVIDNAIRFAEIDLDTVVGEIIIGYAHRCTNRPAISGENGNIIFIPHTDYPTTYGQQIYISRPSGHIHCRTLENGVWSKWVSITNNYSTSEEIIGKWVDGKPIYRKCFVQSDFSHINYGDISVNNMVNMTCTCHQTGSGGQWRTIPWLYSGFTEDWAGGFYTIDSSKRIMFQIGDSLAANVDKVIVVIEYTKTTD